MIDSSNPVECPFVLRHKAGEVDPLMLERQDTHVIKSFVFISHDLIFCCHSVHHSCLLLPVNLESSPLIPKCPPQDAKHRGAHQKKHQCLKAPRRRLRKRAQTMRRSHPLSIPDQSLNLLNRRASGQLGQILQFLQQTQHRRPLCLVHVKHEISYQPLTRTNCRTIFAKTYSNALATLVRQPIA
jgi:hypothetical protein